MMKNGVVEPTNLWRPTNSGLGAEVQSLWGEGRALGRMPVGNIWHLAIAGGQV